MNEIHPEQVGPPTIPPAGTRAPEGRRAAAASAFPASPPSYSTAGPAGGPGAGPTAQGYSPGGPAQQGPYQPTAAAAQGGYPANTAAQGGYRPVGGAPQSSRPPAPQGGFPPAGAAPQGGYLPAAPRTGYAPPSSAPQGGYQQSATAPQGGYLPSAQPPTAQQPSAQRPTAQQPMYAQGTTHPPAPAAPYAPGAPSAQPQAAGPSLNSAFAPRPASAPTGYAPAAAPARPAPSAPVAAPATPAGGAATGTARPPDKGRRIGLAQVAQTGDIDLDSALRAMIEMGASDLHLTVGAQPMVRMDGGLKALEGFPVMNAEALQRSLYAVISLKQRESFEEHLELDFAYAVRGVSRFRVNMYRQRDSVGAAFRMIPYEIKPLEELGVPPIVANFAGLPRGLVLVTGPTGSGKSTTLASIIDLANRTRSDHIMTVEDPIEFLHRHKKSLINQREVGADTHSFAAALKHVLRQDPDIILVGELRDLETISVALTAAETGHLVFGTLHTQDAAQTVDRIIDVFPAFQQDQVRTQLASALQGVVSQTLCKKANGRGRVVATEVMIATPAIRNLIREGKTHQIYSAMQAGASHGMHTMDQHLADLVKASKITYEGGLEKCQNVEDYNRLVGRTSRMAQGAGSMNDPHGSSGPGTGMPPLPPIAPPIAPMPRPATTAAPHQAGGL